MKKTLITLFALAGVASADTYTVSTPEKTSGGNSNAWGFAMSLNADDYLTNNITDDVTALTLESITLTSRAYAENPGAANDIKVAVYTYESGTLGNFLGLSTNSTGEYKADTTYTLSFESLSINPNQCYQFLFVAADTMASDLSAGLEGYESKATRWSISLANGFTSDIPEGWGTYKNKDVKTYIGQNYVPVTTFKLSIPEPTTATLSLLALAGLAARRRRR